ncbi:hypothetical protein BD779DRAFT_1509060 [Infundibulicybe gibba]|nr:hypothetical protein BD779DRAFT_1509060 [Infundibulicybe gibba]
MLHGPPTPPPTSAKELQDEARVRNNTGNPLGSQASSSLNPTQSRPDAYQYTFSTIKSLAAQQNFQDLVDVAEKTDINSDSIDQQSTRLLNTTPLVLAYLIMDDLPSARFALLRLPDKLASLPLSKALSNLLASAWERKHSHVYVKAEILFNMASQSDFPDAKFGSLIAEMVTVFVESFRSRTFLLLSKAYTSLPLSLGQTYLGMPADQLILAAERNNWLYDPSTQILSPVDPKKDGKQQSPVPTFSSLETFHFVADSVARLEI